MVVIPVASSPGHRAAGEIRLPRGFSGDHTAMSLSKQGRPQRRETTCEAKAAPLTTPNLQSMRNNYSNTAQACDYLQAHPEYE